MITEFAVKVHYLHKYAVRERSHLVRLEGFAVTVTTHLLPLEPSLYPNPHFRLHAAALLLPFLGSQRLCASPNSKRERSSGVHTHAHRQPCRMHNVHHRANAHSKSVARSEDPSVDEVSYPTHSTYLEDSSDLLLRSFYGAVYDVPEPRKDGFCPVGGLHPANTSLFCIQVQTKM